MLKKRAVTVLQLNVLAAAHHECSTRDWATSGGKASGAREGSEKTECSDSPFFTQRRDISSQMTPINLLLLLQQPRPKLRSLVRVKFKLEFPY